MSKRGFAVVLLALALGCAGAGPEAVQVAPFDDVAMPGPPWDQGKIEDESDNKKGMVVIHYAKLPGTEEEAVTAFRAAATASGWTEEGRSRPGVAHLRKTGARLQIHTNDGDKVRIQRWVKPVVDASWPTHPSCPEGTRVDPNEKESHVCYLVGTEMEGQGPCELHVEDWLGKRIEKGQLEAGLRIGRWTTTRKDEDDTVYDVVTEYGPQESVRTWTRKDTGKLVLTETLKGQTADATRHGPSRWEGGPTIEFVEGEPAPPFAQSAACEHNPIRADFEDEIEILDVDPQGAKVAFRVLDLPNPDRNTRSCAYPGLQDPQSGVTLGLLDVDTGQVTPWTVYEAVDEDEPCTTEAEASRQLAAAKARFAELGLDVTRKPAPLAPEVEEKQWDSHFELQLSARKVGLAVARIDGGPITRPERYAFAGEEVSTTVGTWEGIERPRLFQTFAPQVSNLRPDFELVGAWEEGGQALVAWKNDAVPLCETWGFVSVR